MNVIAGDIPLKCSPVPPRYMAFSDSRIIKFNAPNCAPFTFWRTAVTTSKEAKSLAKVVVPINAKATKQPTKKPLAEKSTAAKALDVTRLPKKNGTKGVSSKAGAVVESDAFADSPLYYVGIGASAGGLEALRPFVAGLPAHANMTYIVAQHMSPDHRSLMVELLARETTLTVAEASNNLPPKADTIYVAPPNSDVTVTEPAPVFLDTNLGLNRV